MCVIGIASSEKKHRKNSVKKKKIENYFICNYAASDKTLAILLFCFHVNGKGRQNPQT